MDWFDIETRKQEIKEYYKKWRINNKEKCKQYNIKHWKDHKEELSEYNKLYRKNQKEIKRYIIYRIWNIDTNKHYIGLTTQKLITRINGHKRNKSNNSHIDNAIRKHGIEKFKYEILKKDICDIEELKKWEIWYIEYYDSYNNGYNLTKGGEGTVGRKYTDEQKRKLSESQKGENNHFYGKHHSEETRKKISENNIGLQIWLGRKHNEESKKKMSEGKKGRLLTDEWINNISKATKGENNPMYGKHHSEETRKKISEGKKGSKWTPQQMEKNLTHYILQTPDKNKLEFKGKKLLRNYITGINKELEKGYKINICKLVKTKKNKGYILLFK